MMGSLKQDEMENGVTEAMLNKASHPRPLKEGSKMPQYLYSLAATMSAFCAGTALAWTGPALPLLKIKPNATADLIQSATANLIQNATENIITDPLLKITDDEGSWVGSLITIGGLLGALPAGYISNLLGRKIVCASLSIPFFISWLIITYATSVWHLYAARFIAGIATGMSCAIAPMYVGEIAESSVRGTLGSFFQLMLTVGILYTYSVGAFFSYTSLAVACGAVPIVFLLVFFNAPESPAYLLGKGRRTEAMASLKRLRGVGYDVSSEINDLQKELEKSSGNEASFGELFSKKAVVNGLIISLGLMFFQQLSGVNAVIFYANDIFKSAGSKMEGSTCSIIIGAIQVVCTYCSSLLIDKAGRKILLLVSAGVMAICQALLGLYFYLKDNNYDVSSFSMIPLGSVALFIVIFSFGFGPIPWMMTGEVFGNDVKGAATGIAVGLNWFMAFLVTKSFDPLTSAIGTGPTFGIFSIICAVGVVFVFFRVIETKGRSLDEIQKILSGE